MSNKITVLGYQLNPMVGDIEENIDTIFDIVDDTLFDYLNSDVVPVMVFPECFVTGYPPEDLLERDDFMDKVSDHIDDLRDEFFALPNSDFMVVFGAPTKCDGLHNTAVVMGRENGKWFEQRVHKTSLPNVNVFDERRYFTPAPTPVDGECPNVVVFKDTRFAIAICEDIWQPELAETINQSTPEDSNLDFVIVLNGSPYEERKMAQRIRVADEFRQAVGAYGLMYVNMYGGQDEIVFDGGSFVVDVSDVYWVRSFCEDVIQVYITNSNAMVVDRIDPCGGVEFLGIEENWDQVVTQMNFGAIRLGLEDYMKKNGFKKALIGNSGGIDSALALSMAALAIGSENVISVCMPYEHTSNETREDAEQLAMNWGIAHLTIPIHNPVYERDNLVDQALDALGFAPSSVSLQNSQARERGMILMQLSNSIHDAMVISTGNRSEMSAGYATLYGDMCGGFNPNKDLYKHQVYELSRYINDRFGDRIPQRIIDKEPTAELAPDQKDSDSLPPYEILDLALECLVDEQMSVDDTTNVVNRECRHLLYGKPRHEVRQIISDLAYRVFVLTEYKRRQAPPGVKIRAVNFGRGRRFPITNGFVG